MKTGSQRDTRTGKGRYDLVSPVALHRIAQLYERGADKYDARNWEKGQELSVYMDSGLRHANEHLRGMRDEDHLAGACWNFMGAIHTEEMIRIGQLPKYLSDLPNFTGIPFENRFPKINPKKP